MNEVCFPLTSNNTLCQKHVVIDELKKIAKDVECCDDKSPLCRAIKKADEEETKTDDLKCYCGSSPGHHNHVMMDGKPAKSEMSEAERKQRDVRWKWCPPCVHIHPLLNPINSCYRADASRKEGERVSPRNGIPPEENTRNICRTVPQQLMPGVTNLRKDDELQDEFFGGQHCPSVHPAPTKGQYYCPAGHSHWSPPHTLQCRYPNTCVASCFHHPAVSDWVYQQPKYKSYLQNTNDRPFKNGF